MAGDAGDEQHGGRARPGACGASSSAIERRAAVGPVDPERDERGRDEQREAELEHEVAAPEGRDRSSGTSAPRSNAERSAKSAVASDDVDRHRDERHRGRDEERDRQRPQLAARHAADERPRGRRSAARRGRPPPSPTRKATQRIAISRGVAAVSEIDGIDELRRRPGFGPTAKVNAPRTGWPSTEITRQ